MACAGGGWLRHDEKPRPEVLRRELWQKLKRRKSGTRLIPRTCWSSRPFHEHCDLLTSLAHSLHFVLSLLAHLAILLLACTGFNQCYYIRCAVGLLVKVYNMGSSPQTVPAPDPQPLYCLTHCHLLRYFTADSLGGGAVCDSSDIPDYWVVTGCCGSSRVCMCGAGVKKPMRGSWRS